MTMGSAVVKGALSVMSADQKHRFISSIIDRAVEKINTENIVDMKLIQKDYACGEERSILLVVKDCLPLGVLFVMKDGKLLRLPADENVPTVTIIMGQDDFINVAKGSKTIEMIALASLDADIIGDFIVRDFMTLRRLFRTFGKVILEIASE